MENMGRTCSASDLREVAGSWMSKKSAKLKVMQMSREKGQAETQGNIGKRGRSTNKGSTES